MTELLNKIQFEIINSEELSYHFEWLVHLTGHHNSSIIAFIEISKYVHDNQEKEYDEYDVDTVILRIVEEHRKLIEKSLNQKHLVN